MINNNDNTLNGNARAQQEQYRSRVLDALCYCGYQKHRRIFSSLYLYYCPLRFCFRPSSFAANSHGLSGVWFANCEVEHREVYGFAIAELIEFFIGPVKF
jgi:hypothetical protein